MTFFSVCFKSNSINSIFNSDGESVERNSREDKFWAPLMHRDFTVSEVFYEVHMTHVLRSARIINVVAQW